MASGSEREAAQWVRAVLARCQQGIRSDQEHDSAVFALSEQIYTIGRMRLQQISVPIFSDFFEEVITPSGARSSDRKNFPEQETFVIGP